MTRALRGLAVALGIVAILLCAAAVFMGLQVDTEDVLEGSLWGGAVLVLALIGCVIAIRRPRNVIGWLLVMAGLGEILAGVSNLYGAYGDARGLPGSDVISWVGGSMWAMSAAALLIFLPLYFPTGRPPTTRWRWVGWLGVAGIAGLFLGVLDVLVFMPALMGEEWEVIEAASQGRMLFMASEASFPLMMAAAPVALLSLIVRFLRSRGEERQQIKLLVFAVALTVTFVLVLNLVEDVPRLFEAFGSAVALPSIGIATMVAVLKYRLFDIDRLVSRTLTYALLTVLLVGVYLGAVTAVTWITTPVAGESAIAVAAATLIAAAIFQPARRRIQSGVDRRFNRARYDARHTVESFASSLRQEVDIDDVQGQLTATVDDILSPSRVFVWLRPRGSA